MSKFTLAVLTIVFAAMTVLGQGQGAPTLRIVTEDPNLPSELFYGNIKVKPTRLRPGTNTPITIDDSDFFVSQHYIDFLARFPDQGGLDYWTQQVTLCGNDAACINKRRVAVSAAFFIENEFQQTGYYVYKLFKGTLNRQPVFAEFKPDRRTVVGGATIDAGKSALASAFVQRPEFLQKYPNTLGRDAFVDAVIATVQQTSGVDISAQRSTLLSQFDAGGRAAVIKRVADDPSFSQAEYNRAFVAMQYWGYLNRDYDQGGYQFWLDVVNNRVTNNYRAMVCAFITSREYQERFGSTVTRTNADCANIN